MNQDWFKDVLMITRWWQKTQRSRTLHDNKDDDLKNQRISSRLNQEHFKVREEIWFQESRIKNQESRFKVQASKNQDQDSRIKRIINQDKYEKVFFKNWVAHGFFSKPVYQRVFTLW